jgi:excisionase family DNA binding protein
MSHLITAQDVAEWIGVSVDTVQRYTRQGELPAFKLPAGYRYDPDDVYAWLEKHRPHTNGDKQGE